MAPSRYAKGPVHSLFQKWRVFNNATPELYGGSLLKNFVIEAPALAFSGALVLMGGCIVTYVYLTGYKQLHFHERPYKQFYTVYRPDDPRIERIRNVRPAYYNSEGTLPEFDKPVKDAFQK